MEYIGLKNVDYFRKSVLNPLVEKGLLSLTIPDKPKSKNQKYIANANNTFLKNTTDDHHG